MTKSAAVIMAARTDRGESLSVTQIKSHTETCLKWCALKRRVPGVKQSGEHS